MIAASYAHVIPTKEKKRVARNIEAGEESMSKAVVRSRVAPSRRCRSCGASVRPPRWLCSRCGLADESVTTRKLADTDTQVQALRRNTGKSCVSIASSLDTLPPASVPYEMRDRWLRGCVRPRVPWPWPRSGSPRPPRPRDKCRTYAHVTATKQREKRPEYVK